MYVNDTCIKKASIASINSCITRFYNIRDLNLV